MSGKDSSKDIAVGRVQGGPQHVKLDPDEKALLESFERGEWTSVEGDRAAVREYARRQLPGDVKAGFDAIVRDTSHSLGSTSNRHLAKPIETAGRARRRKAR